MLHNNRDDIFCERFQKVGSYTKILFGNKTFFKVRPDLIHS